MRFLLTINLNVFASSDMGRGVRNLIDEDIPENSLSILTTEILPWLTSLISLSEENSDILIY